MTTENLLLSTLMSGLGGPAPAAISSGITSEQQASATDPTAFLQALLTQMQSGEMPKLPLPQAEAAQPAKAVIEPVSAAKTPDSDLLQQLKALLTAQIPELKDAPAATAAVPANTVADGKLLPPSDTKAGKPNDTDNPAANPLLAFLAQFIAQPTPVNTHAAATEKHDHQAPQAAKPDEQAPPRPDENALAQLVQAAVMKLDNAPTTSPAQASKDGHLADSAAQTLSPILKQFVTPMTIDTGDKVPAHQPTAVAAPSNDFGKALTDLERVSLTEFALPTAAQNVDSELETRLPESAASAQLPPIVAMNAGQTTIAQAPLQPMATNGIGADQQPAPIQTPVDHPAWSQELGDRIVWMAGKGQGQGLQTAEIKLNPAHLGPVEVRVHMNQDQASVQFVSNHAAIREAIESAVPKLREMLSAQQLNLADVNVSPQSQNGGQRNHNTAAQFGFDQQSSQQRQTASFENGFSDNSQPQTTALETRVSVKNGLLSLYA